MSGVVNVNISDIRDYLFEKVVGFQIDTFPKKWELEDEQTGTQKNQGSRD